MNSTTNRVLYFYVVARDANDRDALEHILQRKLCCLVSVTVANPDSAKHNLSIAFASFGTSLRDGCHLIDENVAFIRKSCPMKPVLDATILRFIVNAGVDTIVVSPRETATSVNELSYRFNDGGRGRRFRSELSEKTREKKAPWFNVSLCANGEVYGDIESALPPKTSTMLQQFLNARNVFDQVY